MKILENIPENILKNGWWIWVKMSSRQTRFHAQTYKSVKWCIADYFQIGILIPTQKFFAMLKTAVLKTDTIDWSTCRSLYDDFKLSADEGRSCQNLVIELDRGFQTNDENVGILTYIYLLLFAS